jgi:phospholipid N-methyltransferase
MGTLAYIRNFFTDRYIASVTPTSIYGVRRVCGKIGFAGSAVLVEFGPGTGVFTRFLLERIPFEARLILIERNPNFAEILRAKFPDPRVSVVNDSAENVLPILRACGGLPADYILSGIPFSFFPEDMRKRILEGAFDALRPGGKFLAYQTFYQPPVHLRIPLEERFGSIHMEYEMRNIPPLGIYEAIKENGCPPEIACDAAGG